MNHSETSRCAFDPRSITAIGFCCLVAMLDGADTQALAIAAPAIARDLALGPGSLGLVFSASLFGAAVGALVAGGLADRLGVKFVLVLCTLLFGGLQFATAYAESLDALLVMRAAAGLGLGGAAPCFLALAAAAAPPSARARVLGVVWAFYPIGAFAGGFVNGWIVQNRSWQEVFVVGGGATIIAALLLAIAVDAPRPPNTERSRATLHHVIAADPLLRYRTTLLCATFFGVFGTLAAIVVWMPALMADSGFPAAQGGAVLSWHALGALVSIAAGGFLFERFGARIATGGTITGSVLLVVLGASLTGFWPMAVVMALLGVSLGLAASGAIALGGMLFADDIRSSGLGLAMGIGRAGQMLLPYLIGLGLAEGLPGGFVLQASVAFPLLAALAAILLSRSLAR